MTKIRVDPDAHGILVDVKKDMRARGINGPTFSDAIREMHRQLARKD